MEYCPIVKTAAETPTITYHIHTSNESRTMFSERNRESIVCGLIFHTPFVLSSFVTYWTRRDSTYNFTKQDTK